jgi:hypothetical protein
MSANPECRERDRSSKRSCLSAVVAGSQRLLVFPNTADTEMVLEILSYTRKVLDNRDAQGLQMG